MEQAVVDILNLKKEKRSHFVLRTKRAEKRKNWCEDTIYLEPLLENVDQVGFLFYSG